MAYENIIYEVNEGIATITFNRPNALNARNGALLGELSQALDEIAADEDIRVLVLTGAGDKSFVAGADITELATFKSLSAKAFAEKGHRIIHKLQQLLWMAIDGKTIGKHNPVELYAIVEFLDNGPVLAANSHRFHLALLL